jgi:hypothetical protein
MSEKIYKNEKPNEEIVKWAYKHHLSVLSRFRIQMNL